jgi:hypothetical protein
VAVIVYDQDAFAIELDNWHFTGSGSEIEVGNASGPRWVLSRGRSAKA